MNVVTRNNSRSRVSSKYDILRKRLTLHIILRTVRGMSAPSRWGSWVTVGCSLSVVMSLTVWNIVKLPARLMNDSGSPSWKYVHYIGNTINSPAGVVSVTYDHCKVSRIKWHFTHYFYRCYFQKETFTSLCTLFLELNLPHYTPWRCLAGEEV
jgi:hypothetical protein